jgi:MYXO-CTERM domain-containing protein
MTVHWTCRMRWIRCLLMGASVSISSQAAVVHGAEPLQTRPISPTAPWARMIEDELSVDVFEQIYGVRLEDLPSVEPVWQGDLYFDETSFGRTFLDAHGLPDPLPAYGYDATPGIVYVAMEGITLQPPPCGGGDEAHSAKRCSPLVSQETVFPAYGDATQRANLLQTLRSYYEPFNIIVTASEPPDWVPYTLAVVGGTASNAGHGGGTCGIANVKCDGLRRNHVSLSFPQSCGSIAAIVGQETAHNWGLEHTNIQADLMYPFNTGGVKTFRNECMTIDHSTSPEPVTQCDYVHAHYCPDGGGEQQNSYAELIGVFGPREPDTVPPQISELFPSEGTYTTEDTITISARVSENSNFLAAKWTWEQGLPEDTESFTRCTNRVCDQHFNTGVDFDPNVVEWNFLSLERPPAGVYRFRFEVVDAYGGYDAKTLTLEVGDAGTGTTGDSGASDSGGSDTGGSDSGAATSDGTAGETDATETTADDTDTDGADLDGSTGGCGCITGPGVPSGPLLLGLLAVPAFVRRRA